VISYESKKLKDHECNYVTHDLELASLIHALKIWCHYLIEMKFIILSDNNDVKYLLNQQGFQEVFKTIMICFDLEVPTY